MIGQVRGVLIDKQPPCLLVDVGGVAYEIEAPMTTFYTLPDNSVEVTLFTHLVVRDDAHLLYGFASLEERALFRALIKVNGVGAKMALAILSGMEAERFARCIHDGDADSLVKLPGVGKKTAQRLIMEMRDRLRDWQFPKRAAASDAGVRKAPAADEAISALVALGYKSREAEQLVSAVGADGMSSEALIRAALKNSMNK